MGRRALATLSSALIAVAIAAIGGRARADEPDEPDDTPEAEAPPTDPGKDVVNFGLEFERSTFGANLARASFSGDGQSILDGHTQHFGASGAQLGLLRPTFRMYGGAIDIGYGVFYGKLHVDVGKSGGDAFPGNPQLASNFDPSNVTLVRFGPELGAQVWFWDHLRLQIGAVVGGDFYSVPIPNYQMKCKQGTSPANAGAMQGWIEPRLAFEVLLGDKLGVGIGGFVGTDLLAPASLTTGLTLSFTDLGHE